MAAGVPACGPAVSAVFQSILPDHQSIIEFKGRWYFIYHNGAVETSGGSFRRSVCIDYLYYDADDTMKRVEQTTEGISIPPVE